MALKPRGRTSRQTIGRSCAGETGGGQWYRPDKPTGKPLPALTGDRPPDRPLADAFGEATSDAKLTAQRLKEEQAARLAPRRYRGTEE